MFLQDTVLSINDFNMVSINILETPVHLHYWQIYLNFL